MRFRLGHLQVRVSREPRLRIKLGRSIHHVTPERVLVDLDGGAEVDRQPRVSPDEGSPGEAEGCEDGAPTPVRDGEEG